MDAITIHCSFGSHQETFTSSTRNVTIGRGGPNNPDLDLSFDESVKANHARLYYHLNTWWIENTIPESMTCLNDEPVTHSSMVSSGDRLRLGNTTLHINFPSHEVTEPGQIHSRLDIDEARLSRIAEDTRLEIFARISEIAAFSRSRQSMLEGFLREIVKGFPQAERRTLLLIEDGEMVPRVFWPPARAGISFTLARQAVLSQQAFQWDQEAADTDSIAESLLDTTTALYAPVMSGGTVVGVLHIDASTSTVSFSEQDLRLLGIIANTIGGAMRADLAGGVAYFPKVFISYSHQDRHLVDRLAADLRRRRIRVWFDERLRTGEAWRKQLASAIGETDAFLLLLSPEAVDSDEVNWEMSMATAFAKKVLPLMHRTCEAPAVLAELQYVDLRTNYLAGLEQIVNDLYRMDQVRDERGV